MRFARKFYAIMFAMLFGLSIGCVFCTKVCAIDYVATASPDTLESAGYVDLAFRLTNTSSESMTDITLVSNGVSYRMSGVVIAPGHTQELMLDNYYVTEEQLDNVILFLMTWTEGITYKSEAIRVKINRGSVPEPTIEPTQAPIDTETLSFSYSVDKPGVEKNGTVELTYVITNTSSETVHIVNLLDTAIAGNTPIISDLDLAAGQDYTATYTYTMGDESVSASPVLTYVGTMGANKSIRGNTIKIDRVTVQMDVNVVQGETTVDGTIFTITVTNNGNKTITSIKVVDDLGNSVTSPFDLGIGESKKIEHNVPSDKERELSFTVSCTLATGENDSVITDKYHVWQYTDPSLIGITFDVELVDGLNAEGYVTMKFTATNTSDTAMHDLTITENGEVVGSLKDLAQGESDSGTYTIYAKESKELSFTLTATDSTGKPWEYNTIITADEFSTVDNGSANPSNVPLLNVGSTVSKTLAKILTVLAILAAIAGATLIVLAVLERREVARLREKKRLKRTNSGNGDKF